MHLAAHYVKEHLSRFITQKPEIIEGPIKLTIERVDHLSTADWSWGRVSTVDSRRRTIFIADAHQAADTRRYDY